MPLTTTFGALSKFGFSSPSTIQLSQVEYVTTYTVSVYQGRNVVPGQFGSSYINTDTSFGITKLNINGTVDFQKSTSIGSTQSDLFVDNDYNVYSYTSAAGKSYLLKFNSSGTLLWQKSFNGVINSICVDNSLNVYLGVSVSAVVSYVVLSKWDSAGNLINARRIFDSTTGTSMDQASICYDFSNNRIIVGSTFNSTQNQIYIGLYPDSNTTTNNTILRQYSATNSYYGPYSMLTNGTSIYHCCTRRVSSINYKVYVKLSSSTGIISYSNRLSLSGAQINLRSMTRDSSGDLYIVGETTGTSGYFIIAKISESTGNVLWAKTITRSGSYNKVGGGISWSNGYVYFSVYFDGSSLGWFKLKDDGSLPNGTYQSLYIISNATLTVTALNSDNVGTLLDNPNTASLGITPSSQTVSNASLTPTTTILP